MDRPGVVWVFTILACLGIIWSFFNDLYAIMNFPKTFGSIPIFVFIKILRIIGMALIIPSIIMVYHFFMLHKSAKMWTHISYGLSLGLLLVEVLLFMTMLPSMVAGLLSGSIFIYLLLIFFWWAIVDYINKKQVNGQSLFN